MPDDNVPSSEPNEVPYRVQTALGPAVITLVSVARCIEPSSGGSDIPIDRIILRSTVVGHSDMYAVFERNADHTGRWRRVTGDLTLAELGNWPAHRCSPAGTLPAAFQEWLQQMTTCS